MFVPHYAMSGGTLIALAADEIVMCKHSVLGAIDPQLGEFPAASLIKVIEEKPMAEIDDNTLIMADVGRKAIAQVKAAAREFLERRLSPEQAETLAEMLSTGQWTHDYPISAAEATQLGLPVNTDMPDEVMELMSLYPQPVRHSGGGSSICRCRVRKGRGDHRRREAKRTDMPGDRWPYLIWVTQRSITMSAASWLFIHLLKTLRTVTKGVARSLCVGGQAAFTG